MELAGRYSNPKQISGEVLALVETPLASERTHRTSSRRKQTRLSEGEVDALRAQYESGKPIPELAAFFDIHRSTVMAHVARLGLEPRTGRIDRHFDEAAELYASGWSLARIGAKLDVDAETVRQAFMRGGIPVRPRPGRSP